MIDDNNRKQQNCVSNYYSYLSISESSIIQVRNPILEDNQLWEFFNSILGGFFLGEISLSIASYHYSKSLTDEFLV